MAACCEFIKKSMGLVNIQPCFSSDFPLFREKLCGAAKTFACEGISWLMPLQENMQMQFSALGGG